MRSLNRIKVVFNPEDKKHYVCVWNRFFYPDNPAKMYEDWESLFPIEDVRDWKERLVQIIENQMEDFGY